MKLRAWTRVAAVVSSAGLAVTAHAGPAEAAPRIQVSTVSLVLADGAAVAIPVRVSCDPGTTPNVNVEISQRSGRQIATAGGSEADFICDGTPRVVQVFVLARTLAFTRGPAFVTANVFACSIGFSFPPIPISSTSCSARTSRTTRLVPGEIRGGEQL